MPRARSSRLTLSMLSNCFQAVCSVVAGMVLAASLTIPAAAAETSGYAGSDTCKTCHEEIYNNLQKTPHFSIETGPGKGWDKNTCEACHGPGAKHAESASADDIRNPAKLTPLETDRTCLTCHLNQRTSGGRIASGHAKDQVGCTTCHFVHGAAGAKLVEHKKSEINARCSTCHISEWAAFNRPYKHRLPEGAMSCVDCHNPHATFQVDAMRTSFGNEPGCLQCHSDKRGPFVFEHAPMRLEGCGACHEPHGSANPRMLVRNQVLTVCLECHANVSMPAGQNTKIGGVPPAFHDLRTSRFQNCTVCHVKVHGSYVDRELLR